MHRPVLLDEVLQALQPRDGMALCSVMYVCVSCMWQGMCSKHKSTGDGTFFARNCTGAVILDATFGLGGHTRALLNAAKVKVLASDCDPDAVTVAKKFADEVRAHFNRSECKKKHTPYSSEALLE